MDHKSNEDKAAYMTAQAVERFLKRKCMGIECAIEALEIIG